MLVQVLPNLVQFDFAPNEVTRTGKLCWWAALSAGIRTSRGTDVEGADRHRRRRESLVRR